MNETLWLKHAMYVLMCRVVQVTTLFPHYVQSSMTEGVRTSTDHLAYLSSDISPCLQRNHAERPEMTCATAEWCPMLCDCSLKIETRTSYRLTFQQSA